MAVSYKMIGRHIKTARKAHNLTQEAMAEQMKMSVAHFGRLERGERSVNLERLSQISLLLDTPLEQLVVGCVEASVDVSPDAEQEDVFLKRMTQFAQTCSDENLNRMLKICEVLAAEESDK